MKHAYIPHEDRHTVDIFKRHGKKKQNQKGGTFYNSKDTNSIKGCWHITKINVRLMKAMQTFPLRLKADLSMASITIRLVR